MTGRDLGELQPTGDASFFTVFGHVVRYPSTWVWPLAVLALAAVVALGALARSRGLASLPRLLAAVPLSVVPVVVAALVAFGLWQVLVAVRPTYGNLMSFEPYRPVLYRWALASATAAVVATWYLLLRRRIGAEALTTGALLWPALFGVAMAALVPGMSYYGALTVLAATGGAAAALLVGDRRPLWQAVALTVGALPGVVLWSIGGRALLTVMGVGTGYVAVFFFAMGALTVLPLLAVALPGVGSRRRRAAAAPAVLAALAVALTAGGLVIDRFDEEHPAPAYLMYVLDADAGTALWGSVDGDPHPWAARYLPDAHAEHPLRAPLPGGTELARTGPAEAIALKTPEVTVLDARVDGDSTVLRVRVEPRRDVYALAIHADRPVTAATLHVTGQPAVELTVPAPEADDGERWPGEVQFFDPPADGVEFTLRVQGTARPRIGVTDWSSGLSALPGFTPRPPGADMPPAGPPTDTVVTTRIHQP